MNIKNVFIALLIPISACNSAPRSARSDLKDVFLSDMSSSTKEHLQTISPSTKNIDSKNETMSNSSPGLNQQKQLYSEEWGEGTKNPKELTSDRNPSIHKNGDKLSFSFENTPIKTVIDSILYEGLGFGYSIDPAVNGNITIRTSGNMYPQEILSSLEQALLSEGVSMIYNNDGSFTITTNDKSGKFATAPKPYSKKYATGGTVIVPLQYVSASNIANVLENLGNKDTIIYVDDARQYIVLRGSSNTLNNLIETISLFDVDWLKSSNFRFYEIKWADPDTIIGEIQSILGGEKGTTGKQFEFISLPRLSGILAISKRPERRFEIEALIEKLDRPSKGGSEKRLFHKWVVFQNAEEISSTLNKLFSSGATEQANKKSINSPSTSGATNALSKKTTNQTVPSEVISDGQDNNTTSKNSPITYGENLGKDNVIITFDKNSNSILVYSSDENYKQIEQIIDQLDIPPSQVMIEVTIAEVVLNDQLQYGVQWYINMKSGNIASFSTGTNNSAPSAFPGFSYRFENTNARAVINALSQVTDVSVVSSPQIMTLDNKTATLQIGDQVPVITQSAQSTISNDAKVVNSIQYRDTGILLNVTPRISVGDTVTLETSQEVSEVTSNSSSSIDSPTIQQRKFNTSVLVYDGQTIALGGLIRTRKSIGDTRVPYIGSIPVLGALFRNRDNSVRRTELIVFITPKIVRNDADAYEITQILKSKLHRIEDLSKSNNENKKK